MALDSSKLQINLEDGERWRRTLTVTVPADVVAGERSAAAAKLAKRLNLPGFRKGRIPAGYVEQRFGSALDSEMLEQVIGDAYKAALDTQDVSPISEGELGDVQYEPGQDLTFAISFDVAPQVELERMGGFAVERPSIPVGDAEVDQVLERLRDQNAPWDEASEGIPQTGDLVEVEVLKLDDGDAAGDPQPYQFILGQGDAIPDVEAAIQTLEVGGEGTFTVGFPEDFPNEERRGDSEELRITLKGRRVKTLPELDDEFAKGLGEFEDLATLRSRVEEDLRKDADNQAESAVRGRLLDLVLEANPFEVPESMIGRYLESVMGEAQGMDPERLQEIRESLRPEAERAVQRILLIDRLAETQSLAASEDEIDERVETIAEANNSSPAEVYARLQKSGQLESLEREITESKVFDFLKSQSEITEAS
jgi:trigger factor